MGKQLPRLGTVVKTIAAFPLNEFNKDFPYLVLVKSEDLSQVAVFEFETIRYDPEIFEFEWNKNRNLEGFRKGTGDKRFVWQPHGSQFTIIEEMPLKSLVIKLKKPDSLDRDQVLKAIGFDESWITIQRKE
ncbi:MAG TPA: hypothetical protein VK957_02005 [Lunatimonas sp.]|nr:hypothetical protein [Lunatimonas sp.]